jgi:hypothetical protein
MGRVVGGNIFWEDKRAMGKLKDITRAKYLGANLEHMTLGLDLRSRWRSEGWMKKPLSTPL